MIETIKAVYGEVSVRTTSLSRLEINTRVYGAPGVITLLYLDDQAAEALQNALARMRVMLPCPRYRETLKAIEE